MTADSEFGRTEEVAGNIVPEPSLSGLASNGITFDEFRQRFSAHLVRLVGEFDADGGSVAEYANDVAQSYWDEGWQRAVGPEACAQADYDEWEPA